MIRLLTFRRAAHASPVAVGLLVLANLVPLAGVLLLGWDLPTLVAIYWAENGVVGVFAVARILTASGPVVAPGSQAIASGLPSSVPFRGPPQPPRPPRPGSARTATPDPRLLRLFLAPFFCVHYGVFWLVHGVFVWLALPAMFALMGAPDASPRADVVVTASLFLLASHGASFVLNWIRGGECRTSSPMREMAAPYVRVVILHLTILVGAFAVAILGAPIWALVVMVVLKTGTDLAAHQAERARAAGRMAAAGS